MSAGGPIEERDIQPGVAAVLGEETPLGAMNEPPVNVRVIGPIRTQEMPHKSSATFTKTVAQFAAGTVPCVRLVSADHRRARLTIISPQAFYFAFSNAASQDIGRMAAWPANTPLVLLSDSEVWVGGQTAPAVISAVVESWATGEDGFA